MTQARIQSFRQARANALARRDWSMVNTMDVELARLGFQEPMETTEAPVMEMAVPAPSRRGRRPLPRCEHNMIVGRCPDCDPEEVAINGGNAHGLGPLSD